jgi:hypothetical protein
MRPEKTPARFAFLLLVVGTLVVSATADAEYVRPPPGRVILTENSQPPSHPQQVRMSIGIQNAVAVANVRPMETLSAYVGVRSMYRLSGRST